MTIQQINVGGGSLVTNDGQVKVNTGNGLRPRWELGTPSINNTWQPLLYGTPLGLSGFPTTSWPLNMVTPDENDIYNFTTNTFLENLVAGQVHTWRLQFEFSKQSAQTGLQIQLRNTLSGFELIQLVVFPAGVIEGFFTSLFISIADGASLPAPLGTGQGYELRVMADDNTFQSQVGRFLQVISVTRISHHYATRP